MKKREIKNICHCSCGKKKIVAAVLGIIVVVAVGLCMCCRKSVAVIDFGKVRQSAEVYKSIIAEQTKYEEKLQAQLSLEAGSLQKEDQALGEQKSKLKDADYKKKAAALQKKAFELQQKYQYQAQQILAASQIAVEKIQADVEKIVAEVADDNCVGIVLNKEVTIYADEKTNDITDAFIEALNEKIKPVEYPNPETIQLNLGE